MSKKTLYGEKQERVVTLPTGVRLADGIITPEHAKVIDDLRGKKGSDLLRAIDSVPQHYWFLKDHESWAVRNAVAQFSTEYHTQFKDDENETVRATVAAASTKYHEKFKDDESWIVRIEVAMASDKYHYLLKDDKVWAVRFMVAWHSDKYHTQFKKDPDSKVRAVVDELERRWKKS